MLELKYIAEALKENTSLTTLNLLDNNIGAAGAKDIAEALKVNTSLTTLNLLSTTLIFGRNNIVAAGAKDIAEALKENTSLTTLDLSWNYIGDAEARDIAEALKVNTSLITLNLDGNNIGAAGAQYISEALKENTSLTTLYLCSNNIRNAGVKYIAKALKENTSLTTLSLSFNHIGAAGAKYIAKALKENTSLTTLNLHRNNIGGYEDKAIEKALEHSNILKYNGRNTELHKTLTEFIDKSKSNEYSEILSDCELILNKNAALSELLKDSKYSSEDYNKLKYLAANTDHIEQFIKFSPLMRSASFSPDTTGDENPDLSVFQVVGIKGKVIEKFAKFFRFLRSSKKFSPKESENPDLSVFQVVDIRDEIVKALIGVKDDEGINDFYDFACKIAPRSMSIWNPDFSLAGEAP